MRILIGCEEICGWINLLGSQFEKQGHQVVTISNKNKYFKEFKYTIEKENFERDYFSLRIKNKLVNSLFFTLYRITKKVLIVILKKDLFNKLYVHANNHFYTSTDLYIHIWTGIEPNDADLEKFNRNNVKIVSWFVGSDIRHYPTAIKEFGVNNSYFLKYTKQPILRPMRKLRMHEKYSNIIFSCPDQSSLALRPYFHLKVPIDLSKYIFNNTKNIVPVIVHIPSAPLLKGSPIFEKVMKELKDEGLQFEFKSVINIPNSEVIKLLTNADILLDEIYMHGPGMLGIEAMATGCCVVVKYLETSPASFRPPVVNVNESSVKEKVRELILNKPLRDDLIARGRKFVEIHNDVDMVCKSIISQLDSYSYDYYPDYFRNKFKAELGENLQQINDLTSIIKDCAWYSHYVLKGTRDGLIF
jgi:hypothetical protein